MGASCLLSPPAPCRHIQWKIWKIPRTNCMQVDAISLIRDSFSGQSPCLCWCNQWLCSAISWTLCWAIRPDMESLKSVPAKIASADLRRHIAGLGISFGEGDKSPFPLRSSPDVFQYQLSTAVAALASLLHWAPGSSGLGCLSACAVYSMLFNYHGLWLEEAWESWFCD